MTTIGILGIGHLAEFIIHGAAGKGYAFLLSPRSAGRAERLAAATGAMVADSNQAVVDGADLILSCLPATEGPEILQGLTFRPGQTVLSAMAGTRQAALADIVAPATAFCTMMPGLANSYGVGPCLLYPADPRWQTFLSNLGPVHLFDDENAFVTATAFGALSGASFFLMDAMIGWFVDNGLPAPQARRLVAETLRGNATVLLHETATLAEITPGIATPGGITEALVRILNRDGGIGAWSQGLDLVLRRVRGAE